MTRNEIEQRAEAFYNANYKTLGWAERAFAVVGDSLIDKIKSQERQTLLALAIAIHDAAKEEDAETCNAECEAPGDRLAQCTPCLLANRIRDSKVNK